MVQGMNFPSHLTWSQEDTWPHDRQPDESMELFQEPASQTELPEAVGEGGQDVTHLQPGTSAELTLYTSKNFKKQWAVLDRVARGPRAAEFPEIAKLFGSGNSSDQRQCLRKFIQSGSNLAATEADMVASRERSDLFHRKRKLLTLKQMSDSGYSAFLLYIFL